jgi:uncharacterized protein (TIGR03000 family)
MYSVVLLAALTGGVETPDCHKASCSGCTGGCTGYVSTGCSGGGGSCHGGGHRLLGGGGLFSHRHSCSGSCSGGYGCSGGGYGCSGGYGGGYGCSGGYGGGYGCSGGYGGGYGCSGGAYMGCSGGYPGCGGIIIEGKKPEEIKKMPGTDKPKEEVRVPTPGTIVVELPSDAKLTIDDGATASTSSVRTFVTPELAPAKTFSYVLKAQIVRDGQTLTAEQKINVQAGVETRVNLGMDKFTALTVAAK